MPESGLDEDYSEAGPPVFCPAFLAICRTVATGIERLGIGAI
jgi:hypothetical protein